MSRCLVDYRNRASVEHGVDELVAQRLYAIVLGYETSTTMVSAPPGVCRFSGGSILMERRCTVIAGGGSKAWADRASGPSGR